MRYRWRSTQEALRALQTLEICAITSEVVLPETTLTVLSKWEEQVQESIIRKDSQMTQTKIDLFSMDLDRENSNLLTSFYATNRLKSHVHKTTVLILKSANELQSARMLICDDVEWVNE